MSTVELITTKVQQLPEAFQREVLDFVEFLRTRAEEEDARTEELEWSRFSMEQAIRGMEDDEFPEYTEDDLKERWQ